MIGGRCFTGKNNGARNKGRSGICLDSVVERDHMQNVEELALVFMHAFDVDIEERVRIHAKSDLSQNVSRETLLVLSLHVDPVRPKLGVFRQWDQSSELIEIAYPVRSN